MCPFLILPYFRELRELVGWCVTQELLPTHQDTVCHTSHNSLDNVQAVSPFGVLAPCSIDNQFNSKAPPSSPTLPPVCARALATYYVTYIIAELNMDQSSVYYYPLPCSVLSHSFHTLFKAGYATSVYQICSVTYF
jgi:hypothetical protein